MRIRSVIFDLFDTLLLLESDEAYYRPSLKRLHSFLVENGVNVSFEHFCNVYFEVRDEFYAESRKTLDEPHFDFRVSHTLRRLGHDLDSSDPIVTGATAAFADEFMRYVTLDDQAIDVLKELHKEYKLGLISNLAIPECGRRLLDKFGLTRFFEVIIISGEVNKRKPSPAIFEMALKGLGVEASKAVFVGDMLDLDVMGPKAVGMKTILIKRKLVNRNFDAKPDAVITSLSELPFVLHDS
ncbi:MAG TPA: HAD family hydrolase [Candidatus Bathyarchaeia archaeon]|nr:HAD family hydrolase [Candidatus Bathyarchaeia archaeon]